MHSWRPLLEATSRLLHRLCSIAFAKGGVYELLGQVREVFLQGTAEPLQCRKQDLASFFIPSPSHSSELHGASPWSFTDRDSETWCPAGHGLYN